MRFAGTYFYHFRNLVPQRREWDRGFNLIVGPNGSGKTNFIEALNLISGWGPLERGTKLASLVRWGRGCEPAALRASLWARLAGGGDTHEIFASIQTRCTLKWDERAIGAVAMRRVLPVMSFLPGDMALLKGGASYRRGLLDRVGALVLPAYAERLYEYRRALRQKSALLRRQRDPRLVDRLLAPLGAWLWGARERIAERIAECLGEYSDLQTNPLCLRFIRGGGGTASEPPEDMKLALNMARDRERAAKMPLVGPQRDDIEFTCASRPAASALSQGQSRRAAAALLLASASAVERVLGIKPVLLFDELVSELDASGRGAIISALTGTGNQIFATTTEDPFGGRFYVHVMSHGGFL